MSDTNDLPANRQAPHDLVEGLLQIADRGPEIPAEGADRIKAVIRPQLQARLRTRSRRRWTWTAAAAAAALVAVALVSALRVILFAPVPDVPVAALEVLFGTVEVIPASGESVSVSEVDGTDPVVAGTRVRTDGTSRVALRLTGGQSIRLDVDTTLRLPSIGLAELERGAVYVDSGSSHTSSVEIMTKYGVVREIGTQFEVRWTEGPLSIAVRDGEVSIFHDGRKLNVPRGTAVKVGAHGLIERTWFAPSASRWDWVQHVAPPFDMEGSTVTALLTWVSNETGLKIRFSDPMFEAYARDTVLHGSAAGLTPRQAAGVALASCGLTGDIDSGWLVVRRAGPSPEKP